MREKNIGLYIHIPFCKKKCEYCDFSSYAGKENLINDYVKWLKYEINEVGEGNKLDYENRLDKLAIVKTIYIGGGTPSVIESEHISQIMDCVKENYTLSDNVEITIEVNPGTVSREKLLTYKNSGINRLSIGMQETNDEILKKIGRIHTYSDILHTYKNERDVGFENINIDVMIGLPGQSIRNVEETVNKVIELNPEHISLYSLILEENTKLYELVKNKKIVLENDMLERKMYHWSRKTLNKNGYTQYEISNFCKKGYESKHNLNCWNQNEYIGFGVASHSYTDNIRYSNIESIEQYIENYKQNKQENNIIFHEKQNEQSKMMEYIMLNLRKIKGINICEFKKVFKDDVMNIFGEKISKLHNQKLIKISRSNIALTIKGLDLANIVWQEFV